MTSVPNRNLAGDPPVVSQRREVIRATASKMV